MGPSTGVFDVGGQRLVTPLIRGRAGELKVIGALVTAVAKGRGGVLVIEGPPGIGKSRLLTEVLALADKCGVRHGSPVRHRVHHVGTPEKPQFPVTNVMNDFIAGYVGAAGVQAALIRRAKEGGSYERVNLARCAMFFNSLGTFDTDVPGTGEPNQPLAPDTITAQTPYGEYVRLAPPVQFSETKPYWRDPVLVVRGSSKPAWTTA